MKLGQALTRDLGTKTICEQNSMVGSEGHS